MTQVNIYDFTDDPLNSIRYIEAAVDDDVITFED